MLYQLRSLDGVAEEAGEWYVRALKQRTGRDIGIHGGISLARSLLGARLVDELRLVLAPVLARHGRRLFADDDLDSLKLLDIQRSAAGSLFLRYRRSA